MNASVNDSTGRNLVRKRKAMLDTKAPATSIANTTVSSVNHPSGIFRLSARQPLCLWNRSVIGKVLAERVANKHDMPWRFSKDNGQRESPGHCHRKAIHSAAPPRLIGPADA